MTGIHNIDCYYSIENGSEIKTLKHLILLPKYFHDLDVVSVQSCCCLGTNTETEHNGLLLLLTSLEKTENQYKIFENKGPNITLTIMTEEKTENSDISIDDDAIIWNINNNGINDESYKYSELKNQIELKKHYLESIGYQFVYKTISEEENLSRTVSYESCFVK